MIAAATLPRLLAGIDPSGPLDFHQHELLHGPLPSSREAADLIGDLERAGLRGHGGASFPSARKLQAVAQARGKQIVLINAVEAEPASEKDRLLVECLPHLVLDGAVAAARATGAREIAFAVRDGARDAYGAAARAIAERPRGEPPITLFAIPDSYVGGQETALVNYLSGGPLRPTFTPPRPDEQGINRRPTLVNNAETLAHLALIARNGEQWFRSLGAPGQPGSALVTVAGAVVHPGVYEIEYGSPLASLLTVAGGPLGTPRGVLLGGYAGSWVPYERALEARLDDAELAVLRARVLAGVIFFLGEEACPVAETLRLARWMAGQSARQCGPCLHGLDALADELATIASGHGGGGTLQRLGRLGELTAGRGACAHPDGAVNCLLSALETFEHDFAEHARSGPCAACGLPATLPLPDWHLPDSSPQRRRLRSL